MIVEIATVLLVSGQASTPAVDPCKVVKCRPAGAIDVRLDKETGMTVSFPAMPYAFKKAVYILMGESFSVRYDGAVDKLGDGVYVGSGPAKPVGLHLRLWQESDGSSILAIENSTKRTVLYEAAMQLPKESRLRNTTALPVKPGLTNYESWPHPVAQLLLYNVRYDNE